MTRDEFLRLLEDNLSLDKGMLKGDETLADLHWDSMSVVVFLALVDGHFTGAIDPERVAACKTVPDLVAIVETQLAA
jgi:acyl carrier protein